MSARRNTSGGRNNSDTAAEWERTAAGDGHAVGIVRRNFALSFCGGSGILVAPSVFRRAMYPVYRFLATINSFAPTVLRAVLTAVFFVHGAQKMLGWFGGPGWNAQVEKWTSPQGLDLPYSLAVVGIVAEVVGAAGMLVGFCTRLAALLILGQMAMAIALVHLHNGFLASGGGFEYPMTLGGIALALLYCGGGRLSIDRALTRQLLPPNSGIVGAYKLPSNV